MPRKRRDTSLVQQTKSAYAGAQPNATTPEGKEVIFGGAEVVNIPDELFGYVEQQILRRVVSMLREGRAPRNEVERVFWGVFNDLAKKGQGARPEALLLGVQLAYAAEGGEPIKTHVRDLAKDAQVRYQDLLRVKKLATEKLKELNSLNKI